MIHVILHMMKLRRDEWTYRMKVSHSSLWHVHKALVILSLSFYSALISRWGHLFVTGCTDVHVHDRFHNYEHMHVFLYPMYCIQPFIMTVYFNVSLCGTVFDL